MSTEEAVVSTPTIEKLIAQLFSVGTFYHYLLNIGTSQVTHCSDTFLDMHGAQQLPTHLKEVIDLMHPDDLAFVMEAEAWTLGMYQKIGFEHQPQLKSGYCFRMKTASGAYELFHHQAIHTAKDTEGRISQALNIHTNIHHITQQNNYAVTVTGVGSRTDFYQTVLCVEPVVPKITERLSKRELEVFLLLLKGYSDRKIAEVLSISYHTVRTHHKHILQKTKSKSSRELVKKGLEQGYL